MLTKRPLTALLLAALVALGGCAASDPGSETGEETSAPTDNGDAAPGDQQEPPVAELDDVPDVVANVNGQEIGKDEFAAAYEGQLQQAFLVQQSSGEPIDQGELKRQVADQLVNNQLLTQSAADAGIGASDEDVGAALEGLAAQNGMSSAEELLAALEAQGVSEEIARADVAAQVKINEFLEREIDVEEPSEAELREQYDALVEQMEAQGEQPESEIPPFEDIRDVLADQATAEQRNAEVDRILEDLRSGAEITVLL